MTIMEIALNSYSLRKEWADLTKGGNFMPFVRCLEMLDGVRKVELLDRTFWSDPAILKAIQNVLHDHGYEIFSLGPHICPLVGTRQRARELAEFKKWIDMAADHGIHCFRASLGGGKRYDKKRVIGIPVGDIRPASIQEAVQWTVEVLKPAVEHAETKDVTIAIETHHRYSSNPEYQGALLDALPSKHLGFIFDIGNFETRDLSWKSLELLLKKKAVKYMHAKAYQFDENGFETTLDYPRAIKMMHDAGASIPLSIEWEGRTTPTMHGILHTHELCKYSIAKAMNTGYSMNLNWEPGDILLGKLRGS